MLTLWAPPSTAARAVPPRRRAKAPVRRTASAAAQPTTTPTASDAPTASFTSAASGEWEGAAAAFSRDGTPVELPPRYVPEAFREWGVAVCDWQTQCSTEATVVDKGGAAVRVSYRLKRLLPSVGCEADATAFVDEGVTLDLGAHAALGADGAFVAASPALPAAPSDPPARVEVALPLPRPACRAAPDGSVPPRRVRAVLTIVADPLAQQPAAPASAVLAGVELFSEKRYADFSNGSDSLAGCGGGVGPFAGGARLDAEALEAPAWAPAGETSAADPARGTAAGGATRLLLPLGAWAALRPTADGGLVAEAGFVVESGGGSVRRAGLAAFDGAGRLAGSRLSAETAGGGVL